MQLHSFGHKGRSQCPLWSPSPGACGKEGLQGTAQKREASEAESTRTLGSQGPVIVPYTSVSQVGAFSQGFFNLPFDFDFLSFKKLFSQPKRHFCVP